MRFALVVGKLLPLYYSCCAVSLFVVGIFGATSMKLNDVLKWCCICWYSFDLLHDYHAHLWNYLLCAGNLGCSWVEICISLMYCPCILMIWSFMYCCWFIYLHDFISMLIHLLIVVVFVYLWMNGYESSLYLDLC